MWLCAELDDVQHALSATADATLAGLSTLAANTAASAEKITVAMTVVASLSTQTAVMDCLLMDCGVGRCVVTGQRAHCDCSGTNAVGLHCEDNGNSTTQQRPCPSTDTTECSSHGTCVVPCVDATRVDCTPYCV